MVMQVKGYQRQQIVHDTKLGLADSGNDLKESNRKAINEYQDVINNVLIENDTARTRSAFNDFREAARLKYSSLQENKGADAIGANSVSKQYDEWYDKESVSMADGLDNIDQQKAFKIMAGSRRDTDLDSLATYEAAQHKTHQLSVHNGEIANAQADVMYFYADDTKMENIEAGVRSSFENTFKGLDTREAQQKTMAGVHAMRIKMLSKNGMNDKAREELEKNKDILQGAYFTLDKDLKVTDLREKSQSAADNIVATVTGEQAQLDYARKNYSGAMEEKVLADLRTRQSDIKRTAANMKTQEREEVTGRSVDVFMGGGSKKDYRDAVLTTKDPATINNLLILGERLYPEPGKTITPKQKSDSAYNESQAKTIIDQRVQSGDPMTDTEITNELLPHILETRHNSIFDYNKKSQTANSKANVTFQKTRIEKMYGNGTFGTNKKKAALIKNDVLLGLHEWIDENPGKDPGVYVDEKLDLIGAEKMAEGLGTFIENFIPGPDTNEIRKNIASGDIDRDLVDDLAREKGINLSKLTDEHYEKIMKTSEFMKYKTELIKGTQQRFAGEREDEDTLYPIDDSLRPLDEGATE